MSVSRGQVGFVISSAVVLALGVGAFILALGVGRGLWSRSTAVKDPERVVGIIGLSSLDGASESRVLGPGSLGRLRAMPHFEAVAGQGLTNGRHAEYTLRVSLPSGRRLEALAVTPEYFTLLGIAVRGRDFASGDDRPNAETAAIISDRIWREAFARRDDTIGSVVDTRASPVRVIGVVPAGFSGVRLGERVDIWVPAGVASRFSPVTPTERYGPLFVLARLRWGITPGDAERALADHDFFGRSGRNRLSALPIVDTYGSPADRTLRVEVPGVIALLPVVAAVALLAGCGTLTGLAIVYFERRRAEFAIRRALGCSAFRLTRLVCSEAVPVILAGGAGALLFAWSGFRLLPAVRLSDGIDFGRIDFAVDWTLAGGAMLLGVLCLAAAVLVPVVRGARQNIVGELIGDRAGGPRSRAIERLVLASQAAMAVVLTVAAALLVKTVSRALTETPGFDVARTMFVEVHTRRGTNTLQPILNNPKRAAAIVQLVDGLRTMPGIAVVALGRSPIGVEQAAIVSRPMTVSPRESPAHRGVLRGGAEYLDALGVRVVAGGWPGPAGVDGAAVTESLARQTWPGRSPLGREVAGRHIVAVTSDFAQGSLRLHNRAGILIPSDPDVADTDTLGLVVRTAADVSPDSVVPPVTDLVHTTFPDASFARVATGREVIARDIGEERLAAWFFAVLGAIVLMLAAVGVAGLGRHYVDARRREMGIRAAIGATTGHLVVQTARAVLTPVAAGVVLGLAGVVVCYRAIAGSIFTLVEFDLGASAAIGVLVVVIAAIACTPVLAGLRSAAVGELMRSR